MDQADLKRFGRDIPSSNYIVLDKEDPIIAGDYYFSLEHSILITQQNQNNNSFTARYITSEYESTDYQDITGKTSLPVYIEGENINITARAYQYKLNKITTQIPASTFLNKVHRFQFEDQFCGAVLFYIENGEKKKITLKYSDLDTITDEQAAFYNLSDEHELEVIFKSGDKMFMPSANSAINLYIYSTKGKNVPASFTGDAYFFTSDTRLKSMPIVISFNPTDIIGGKDSPSLTEIKRNIINAISTRNTITTQSDLNNYFSILTSLLDNINNGKIKFIKQRDDIINRLYNAYLLLRDNTNDTTGSILSSGSKYLSPCVPTNTIDGKFVSEQPSSNSTTYIMGYPFARFNTNGDYIGSSETAGGDYYICPFAIYTILSPFRAVKYIYNMTDSTSNLLYSQNNSGSSIYGSSYYMIPVSVNLHRGFAESGYSADDKYVLTLTMTTNFALDYCSDPDSTALSSGGSIEISGMIGHINTKEFRCSSELNSDGIYTTTIEIYLPVADSEFGETSTSGSTATNFHFGNTINMASDEGTQSFYDKETLTINFDGFSISGINSDNNSNNGSDTASTTFPEFVSESKLVFFTNLDDIMKSDIVIHTSETNSQTMTGFDIKEIPVVHSSFFQSSEYPVEARKEGFISQLFTYINLLKENLEKLETSTYFNIKFYNTYGKSVMYNTTDVNLDLELYISLKAQYTGIEYDKLRTEIRSYIRKIVDSMNNGQQGFILSSLYNTLMTAYGSYIANIQFLGLNGTFEQVIEKTGIEEDIGYPPEWLNIDSDSLVDRITFNSSN